MVAMIAILAGFAVLGIAAFVFGTDSRDSNDWREQPRP
jgi:hypothetical protein